VTATQQPDAPPIVLASRSPRRAQLLAQLGLAFDTDPADVDETYLPGEEAGAHAERLAREKVRAVAARTADALVIGSDTVVVIEGDVLGKPRDAADAVRMLMRLQGRAHEVATGIALTHDGALWSGVERVRVTFRAFDRTFAECYARTGEPLDKAGAYGIQGHGAALVERIDGDYYAVMGLPIARLLSLLQSAGFRYDFRALTKEAGR
jgi:septum formation protein